MIISVLLHHFPITPTQQKIWTHTWYGHQLPRPDVVCQTPAVFELHSVPCWTHSQQAQSHRAFLGIFQHLRANQYHSDIDWLNSSTICWSWWLINIFEIFGWKKIAVQLFSSGILFLHLAQKQVQIWGFDFRWLLALDHHTLHKGKH